MFAVHRSFDLCTGVKSASIAVLGDFDRTSVIYHKTVVVERKRTARYSILTLNNGGWDTISTRHVINQALSNMHDFHNTGVYREKGLTYIYGPGIKPKTPFVSGMKIKVKRAVQ